MAHDINNTNHPNEDSFEIKNFLFKVIGKWPLFVISIGLAYGIAFLINRYAKPLYSVSVTLVVNDERKSTAELLISAMDRFSARKNIENEIAILKSYRMAYRTLSKLNFNVAYFSVGRVREIPLYKNPPFYIIQDTANYTVPYEPIYITFINKNQYKIEIEGEYKIKRIMHFGEAFEHPKFNFRVFLSDNIDKKTIIFKKYFFYVLDLNSMAQLYQSRLTVNAAERKGSVLTLTIIDDLPAKAADYLNKLCEEYIKYGLEEKNQVSINTIRFIDSQMSSVHDSLNKAESLMQLFRLQNKIIDISKAGDDIYERMHTIETERAQLEVQMRYLNYIKNYIESKTEVNDIMTPSVMGINDPVLNSLVTELADLYKQRGILEYSVSDKSPSVALVNVKIQKTVEAIKANINSIISTAQLSINNVNERIRNAEDELFQLPLNEQKLLRIKRGFDLNNNIYNFMLQKRADASIAQASNTPDNKILDYARPESAYQIAPKPTSTTSTAIVIGLLIPLALIFAIGFFDNKIRELKEFDKLQKAIIIGAVGHSPGKSDISVYENPKSALAESFRALRTNLQYMLRETDEKVISITSTISGEGKTFCAINLASILAMSNKKVVLMGLDLRKPKIHKVLNLKNDIGISTFLINQSGIDDIIHPTQVPNMYVAVSGPVPPNPSELIETVEMSNLINLLRKKFDYIIIDTPPVAIVTDALLIAPLANCTIFVARQNYSVKDVIKLADDLAIRDEIKHLSVLVNDVSAPSYYGYGYSYRYGYGYGYGYGGYGTYSYSYGQKHGYYGDEEIKLTFKQKLLKVFDFRNG